MENTDFDSQLVENQQLAVPTVKIELNVNEINIIIGALQELPHKVVDGLLRNIMEQAQSQLKG
jgi:hypothetical protein